MTDFLGELRDDEVVRRAEERGEFAGRQSIGGLKRDPFGAGEVWGGDDALAFSEFGERFVRGFEGKEHAGGLETSYGEHFAANFKDKSVAPLNSFGDVGEREAEFADGFG